MNKILIITNIPPLYRKSLWLEFLKNKEFKFTFLYGSNLISGIKEINFEGEEFKKFSKQLNEVSNFYIKNRLLIWQKGVINKCLTSNLKAAIITGDFLVVTNWIAAIILRLKGVKVVFWSHGVYGNESFFKKNVRKLFFLLAHDHLLYERRGKKMMMKAGFNEGKLHVIFNSLDYKKSKKLRENSSELLKQDVYPFFSNLDLPVIIFVGRLTKVKKLDFIIKALRLFLVKNREINLLFVGDGPEKESLKELAFNNLSRGSFHFYGSCYSEDKLSELISMSDLCVSPGNIGLTAIHSLSYGTPVLTHNNFKNQMPEVEVIQEGFNGCFFEEDNIKSLSDNIEKWLFLNKYKNRESIRDNCYKIIDTYYNPEYQLKVISNLLDNKPPLL